MTIRRARPDDADILAGFNVALAEESEGRRLDPRTAARGVARLLERPEKGFYLVAEDAGEVVASLMVTTEWSDWRDGDLWWIQSVYVRPERRRNGWFRRLYEEVKARAGRAEDVRGLRLYVEVENRTAQRAYRALGMKETTYRLYET